MTASRACYEVALRAVEHGISVVPPLEDGTKRPDGAWKVWQSRRPDRDQLVVWYRDEAHTGLGIVCGRVSGNLEMLEAESEDVYQAYRASLVDHGLGGLIGRVEAGYRERTPGGGVHLFYRADVITGNTKLARRRDGDGKIEVLLETRGEGGFSVISPSNGRVHPSGRPYELLSGGVDSIATITPAERDALWSIARMFDEIPIDVVPDPVPIGSGTGKRPGDDFNERGDVLPILTKAGWTVVRRRGEIVDLRRPGKDEGTSATLNYKGSRLFYPFTSSTAFEPERGYSPWRVYALIEHDGDFAAAARALAEEGYGDRKPDPPKIVIGGSGVTAAATPDVVPSSGFALTDMGNAERLVTHHGADLRHCHPLGRWYVWDGTRFADDERGGIELRAKRTARSIYAEAVDEEDVAVRKAIIKHGVKSEQAERINAMTRLARSEPTIPIGVEEFDADPWLLNVRNGTVDLRTGALAAHARAHLITKCAPITFDATATCPKFLAFLDWAMAGDATLVRFLQRAIGYSLTGNTSERMLLILYGEGKNGKSTLLEVIRALMGDYAMRTPTETLLAKREGGIPNDVARLRGVRFVSASEAEEGQRLAEAKIKDLTGGDMVSARFMRGEFFDFMPAFKIWLSTNHKPGVKGTDRAIWDRIKLVPFLVRIDPADQDRDLRDKLIAEAPGILNWAIRGCLDWRREGMGEPQAVSDATASYRSEMDILAGFIDDRCVVGSTATCTAHQLYSAYQRWCEENGERPITQIQMGRRLAERGYDSTRIGRERTRSWVGIGVREVFGHDE